MSDDDSYTEVTSTSWLGRIGQSLVGVLVGLVLIVVAFVVLIWNEKNSVETAKALQEGLGIVVSISTAAVDPTNEGKLVHVSGQATTTEILTDKDFGIATRALKLKRKVEMLQWREDKKEESQKEVGGSETKRTTYTYSKVWSETPIDSTRFKKPDDHANPAFGGSRSQEQVAQVVTVGAFRLSPSLLADLGRYERVPAAIPESLKDKAKIVDDGLYIGQDPAAPQLGDLRVSFSQVKPAIVSLYAAQRGSSFAPYVTKVGKSVERIETGEHNAAAMFKEAASENTVLTWVLRGVGFLLMLIGFALGFKPISVVLDVLPFLGDMAEWGLGFFAFVLAVTLSLVAIAVAWIVFRPLLGIGLLVVAGAVLFGLGRRKQAKA